MNLKQIKIALDLCLATRTTLNIIGSHGIGKTQIISEYCKDNKLESITLRLGQVSDVADIAGLNYPITIDGVSQLERLLPNFLPKTGKGILFLDEWNRAHPDLIQPIFQLVEEGKLNGYTMPKGWFPVMAMNPSNDDYTTVDFKDKALTSRICHVKVIPTIDEFLTFAKQSMDPLLHEFLSTNTKLIDGKTEDFTIDFCSPDRRGWLDKFNKILVEFRAKNLTDFALLQELHAGISGMEASLTFAEWFNNAKDRVTAMDILTNFDITIKRLDENDMSKLSKLSDDCIEEMIKESKEEYFISFSKFLQNIPRDLAYAIFEKTCKVPEFQSNSEYNAMVMKHLNTAELANRISQSIKK